MYTHKIKTQLTNYINNFKLDFIMLQIKSKQANFGINFPTSINEITPDVLTEITKGIKLPKHYCLVAMVFKPKLFEFISAFKNKNANINVTPILAKISEGCESEINANIGDKLIVDRSSLERSVHINIPIMITSTNAANYINDDKELLKEITSGVYNVNGQSPRIIVLEFKIVPINFVSAAISPNEIVNDPFILKEDKVN